MKVIALRIVFVFGVAMPFFYWSAKAYFTPQVGEVLAENLQVTAKDCLQGNRKACEEIGRQAGNTR